MSAEITLLKQSQRHIERAERLLINCRQNRLIAIKEARNKGNSIKQISEVLGISATRVYKMIEKIMNKETQKKLIKIFQRVLLNQHPRENLGTMFLTTFTLRDWLMLSQVDMTLPLLRLEARTMQLSEPNVNCLSKKLTKQLKRLEM